MHVYVVYSGEAQKAVSLPEIFGKFENVFGELYIQYKRQTHVLTFL